MAAPNSRVGLIFGVIPRLRLAALAVEPTAIPAGQLPMNLAKLEAIGWVRFVTVLYTLAVKWAACLELGKRQGEGEVAA